jgi:hypothetical protein
MKITNIKDKTVEITSENYENIFIGNDNNKFNKNIILLSIREMTNLSTKEIRCSMKKYKAVYGTLIDNMVK